MRTFNDNRKVVSNVREKNVLPALEYPKTIKSYNPPHKRKKKKGKRKKKIRAISTSRLDKCVSARSESNSLVSYYRKGKLHIVTSKYCFF